MASSASRNAACASFPRGGTRGTRVAKVSRACFVKESDAPLLVVVESPSKASVLQAMLPSTWRVIATRGHVRDLRAKQGSVDTSRGFAMRWDERKNAREMREIIEKASKDGLTLRLATDPDREGEAIAWHVAEMVPDLIGRRSRCAFSQVTASAVAEAIQNPRPIDMNLVEAALARRALDFLVGFEVSPRMWRKLGSTSNSAGRVQSVALGLLEQRQREAEAFVPTEYHQLWMDVTTSHDSSNVKASAVDKTHALRLQLVSLDGKALGKHGLKDWWLAAKVAARIAISTWESGMHVKSRKTRSKCRSPPPPLNTAALQVAASQQLGMSVSMTMSIAQSLYEGHALDAGMGLITYMRTDSTRISPEASVKLRDVARSQFGDSAVPLNPRELKAKSSAKKIQDAHEAIRPTYPELTPTMIRKKYGVGSLESRRAVELYELIWIRAVGAQMEDAQMEVDELEFGCEDEEGSFTFRTSSQRIVSPGWMACLGREQEVRSLPPLQEQDIVWPLLACKTGMTEEFDLDKLCKSIRSQVRTVLLEASKVAKTKKDQSQEKPLESEVEDMKKLPLTTTHPLDVPFLHISHHTTSPPPMFTEARIVQLMEELGVGRPSTYAPTLSALRERGYIERDGGARAPLSLNTSGRVASAYLSLYFSSYCKSEFTAHVEELLDEIAAGSASRLDTLEDFWSQLSQDLESADKATVANVVDHINTTLGSHLFRAAVVQSKASLLREKSLQREEESGTAVLPVSMHIDDITEEEERGARKCPSCKTGTLGFKPSRVSGGFIGCSNYPACKIRMPLQVPDLAALGRGEFDCGESTGICLGPDPLTGRMIRLKEGRYGTYIELDLLEENESNDLDSMNDAKRGKKTTQMKPPRAGVPPCLLDDPSCQHGIPFRLAVALLRLPYKLGRRSSDQASVALQCGRFGPYLSDGQLFASVPKDTWKMALERFAADPSACRDDDPSFGLDLEAAVAVLDSKGKPPRQARRKFSSRTKGKVVQERPERKSALPKTVREKVENQESQGGAVKKSPRKVSAYNVFVSDMRGTGLSLQEVAKQWQEMDEMQRKELQDRADERNRSMAMT